MSVAVEKTGAKMGDLHDNDNQGQEKKNLAIKGHHPPSICRFSIITTIPSKHVKRVVRETGGREESRTQKC